MIVTSLETVFLTLVNVHGEELTLRVADEKLIFNVESTSKYPHKHGDESINQIAIIDTSCDDHFHKVLNVQKSIHPLSGSPTPSSDPVVTSLSPSLTPFGDSDFLLEETDAFLALDDSIPPEIDNAIYDSEGDILFREKLLNDDPTKDLPPKEKFHFMVRKGIVLGHKISKNGIEVDRAKVDVIVELPPPTTVKGIRSFLGHARFYRRFIQDFSKIARHMTHLLEKETPLIFLKECMEYFEFLKKKLTEAPILVALDWDLPFEIVCDASDFATNHSALKGTYLLSKMLSRDYSYGFSCSKSLISRFTIKKGAENLAADHLIRLENLYKGDLVEVEMNDNFPHESLNMIALNNENEPPWFADIAN
ncbi:hypothetical protein Tco_0919617 [Tanacetum coccineum]